VSEDTGGYSIGVEKVVLPGADPCGCGAWLST
jgi:hypothetical protein